MVTKEGMTTAVNNFHGHKSIFHKQNRLQIIAKLPRTTRLLGLFTGIQVQFYRSSRKIVFDHML